MKSLPEHFEQMLSYICDGATPEVFTHQRGRPRVVNDMVFGAVMKVIRGEAARPCIAYLHTAKVRGLVEYVPAYSTLQRFLRQSETRQHLIRAIFHAADLLARVPIPKRLHTQFRFVEGIKIFGRTYDTLINEVLCAKVAEMTLKCCLYGVQVTHSVELNDDSLLALLESQIPEGLPKSTRDELFQEMVVAVLDGQMRPDRMRGRVGTLLRRVRKYEPSFVSFNDAHWEDRLIG